MAVELDLEAVTEASGRTRFDRALALLVGAAAILAALLATVQVDAGKQEERALHMASRLSVRIFEGSAGGSPRFSFQINSLKAATALAVSGTAAQIAVLGAPETAVAIQARAEADVKAAERLFAIAQSMGDVPPTSSGIDAATLKLVGTNPGDLAGVVLEQNRQMDIADRFGERGNRTLAGLSLLALGAVLIGLAAVLGRGVPGYVLIVAATIALLAAGAWGVAALPA
jgi:hypothetical protein